MLAIAVALLLSQTYPPFSGGTVMNGVDQGGNAHPPLILPPGALGIGNATAPSPGSATPYFNGQLSYSVAAGPLVGDGGLAVFAANYTTTTVGCYQVAATGALGSPKNTTVTGNPRFVALGDFNEDGITDFAVTNRTANVQVFFGSGGCNFAAGPVLYTDGGSSTQGIVAVSLGQNALNAHQSLVVADRSTSLVSVFVGGGDGGFLTPWASTGCPGAGAYQLAAADFNQDDFVDVVMPCNGPNYFTTLFGARDGGFGTPVQTATPSTNGVSAIAVGDFNGDGVQDVVLGGQSGGATESPAVELFLGVYQYPPNTNLFAFVTPPMQFPFISGHVDSSSQGIGVGDFNGDHRTDVVVDATNAASTPSGVQFFAGNGQGILDNSLGVTSLVPKAQGQLTWTNNNVSPIYLTVADLNGDGVSDVIVPNFGGTAGAGVPNLWTIISPAPPMPVTLPAGVPLKVDGWPGGNLGVSQGPEVDSYVNCQSQYATYLGVLPNRRSIFIQPQYDTSPIWVGQYNVVPAPGLPFSLSDAGFTDAGPGQPGNQILPGGSYSADVNVGPQWSRPPNNPLNQNPGLFCVKLSGAQDGTWDGGWTLVRELP